MDHLKQLVCSGFPEVKTFFTTLKGNSIRLAHVNIRSIRKHWDQFCVLTSSLRSFFDAFILTEINVSSENFLGFCIPNFQAFSYTRQGRKGGGIAVFVKDAWTVSQLPVCFTQAEVLALRLSGPDQSLVLLSVYRPPCCNGRLFLAELDAAMSSFALDEHVCMLGDINIDTLRPTMRLVADYLDILSKWGMEDFIRKPTREEFLSGQLVTSCIDHINIRAGDLVAQSAIVETKLADHYFVCCSLTQLSKPLSVTHARKVISVTDPRQFDRLVGQYDWAHFLSTVPPPQIYENLVEVFDACREKATREYKITPRNPENKWMSAEILAAIKEKDLLWAQARRSPNCVELQNKFKMCRNKVNAMIRLAKRTQLRNEFNVARSNIKKTWSLINNIKGTEKRGNNVASILAAFPGNAQSIADDFNHFFSRVSAVAGPDSQSCTLSNSLLQSAYLPFITEQELQSLLASIHPNKRPGIDKISISELRRNFDVIKNVLLSLLNNIIATGNIPTGMKAAIVTPLHKGGDRSKIENYRPISILSCLAKILEKYLFRIMTDFLDTHNVISPHQYGFIQGRGTQTLLEDFSDLLNMAFEHNQVACALFLDIKKAFDSVPHSLLLRKLSLLGFRGPFLQLLQNFLHDRRQCVSLGESRSSFSPIKSGVPQGSILSPLLFNIFVNDLCNAVSTPLFQYADDTLIVSSASHVHQAIASLQTAATRAMDWFAANLITVNTVKTQLVCFHNPLKSVALNDPLILHTSSCSSCTCEPVKYVSSVKYLGVIFDNDLTWNSHLAYVCKKLRALSCIMYNLRYFMPLSVRKVVLHALGYSVLRYGITVYGHCAARWQQRLNSILSSLLKNVAYNLCLPGSANIFTTLQLPNFTMLLMKTIVLKHFWTSDYKEKYIPTRSLRPRDLYRIPRCLTRYGKRMRRYYVPSSFNKLPPSVFEVSSRCKLKNRLRAFCCEVA